MTSLAHSPSTVQVRGLRRLSREAHARDALRLLPSGDGWALIGPEGELVFQALGTRGRRECLEFAQARGVLAVFS
jgi:hypothetical protein